MERILIKCEEVSEWKKECLNDAEILQIPGELKDWNIDLMELKQWKASIKWMKYITTKMKKEKTTDGQLQKACNSKSGYII